MADRTVIVQLKAIVADYKRGMVEAAKATDQVTARGQILAKSGQQLASVGSTLTRKVTLPIVAAGVAVGKLGVDFDRSFSRMQGLAGVAADEVDGLKDSVKDLAVEAGRGPNDVAEGLYFIRSAGLAGATALDALTVSAKGATAGLGTTAVVADAVTSAINAYGEANIDAARAGDVLVATAREGKAEAASLAPQFGRLLPIAAELGVTFDQVGGGLAFLSRSSGSAELAATQLLGVLQKMLEPGEEGARALDAIGMSAADLRAEVRDKGLLTAVGDLRDRLEDAGLQLGDFSRDQQFLQGALQLTGVQADQARQVFDSLADSSGSLATAFDAARSSKGFQISQDLAQLQVDAINLADKLIPIGTEIIHIISGMVDAFDALPGPVQDAVVVLALLAAAAGPVATIGGRLMQVWGKVGVQIAKLPSAMQTAAQGFAAAGIAAIGLETAYRMWIDTMEEARAKAHELAGEVEASLSSVGSVGTSEDPFGAHTLGSKLAELDRQIESMRTTLKGSNAPWDAEFRQALHTAIGELEGLRSEFGAMSDEARALAASTGISADQALVLLQRQRELGLETSSTTDAMGDLDASLSPEKQRELATAMHLTAEQAAELFGASKQGGAGLDDLSASAGNLSAELKQTADDLDAMFGPLFGLIDALDANREAQDAIVESGRAAERAHRAVADAEREEADTARDVAAAQAKVAEALGITADQAQAARDGIAALQDELTKNVDPLFAFLDAVEANQKAQAKAVEAASGGHDEFGNLEHTPDEISAAAGDAARSAAAVESAAAGLAGAIQSGQVSLDQAIASLGEWTTAGLITGAQAAQLAEQFRGAAAAAQELQGPQAAAAISSATASAEQAASKRRADALADAYGELDDATRRQADAHDQVADAADAAAKADKGVEKANDDAAKSALQVQLAAIAVATAVHDGVIDIDTAKAALKSWADQGLLTEDQARNVAAQFDEVAGRADALSGREVMLSVSIDIDPAKKALEALDAELAKRGLPPYYLAAPGVVEGANVLPPYYVAAPGAPSEPRPPAPAPAPVASPAAPGTEPTRYGYASFGGISPLMSNAAIAVANAVIDNSVDRSIHIEHLEVPLRDHDPMGAVVRRLEQLSILRR